MRGQVAFTREPSGPAVVTLVWLFSSVGPLMPGQVALPCKALTAVITWIRLGRSRRRRHFVDKVRVYYCRSARLHRLGVMIRRRCRFACMHGDVYLGWVLYRSTDPQPLEEAV